MAYLISALESSEPLISFIGNFSFLYVYENLNGPHIASSEPNVRSVGGHANVMVSSGFHSERKIAFGIDSVLEKYLKRKRQSR